MNSITLQQYKLTGDSGRPRLVSGRRSGRLCWTDMMALGGDRRHRAGDSNQPACCCYCCCCRRSCWRPRPPDVASHRESTASVAIADPTAAADQSSVIFTTTKADSRMRCSLLLVLTDWRCPLAHVRECASHAQRQLRTIVERDLPVGDEMLRRRNTPSNGYSG